MDHPVKIIVCALLLLAAMVESRPVLAGGVPPASSPSIDCNATLDAWRSDSSLRDYARGCSCPDPNANELPVCGSQSSGRPAGLSHSSQMKLMIFETVFESLLTSLFAPPKADPQEILAAQQKAAALARQQEEERRAREAAAQAAFEKMMRSYKQLDGTQGVEFKILSNTNLAFKTLDGDAEDMAAGARNPFDTPAGTTQPASGTVTAGSATPFFGDTMPIGDLQLLVNPENDPNVVDLGKAVTYLAENIKNSPTPVSGAKAAEGEAKGAPVVRAPECAILAQKLNGYLDQRAKFQKTINLAQEQLQTWQTANRNALLNAAKDGIGYFTGELLENCARRGEAAERLKRICDRNAGRMAKEGLNIAEVKAKIERLRLLSSAGELSDITSKANDWQTFVKDGTSALMAQLTSSNQEIREMLKDPRMEKYIATEAPELNALLDISKIAASNKVFGKWVAKKLPIIAGVELAINQTYNGLDWLLSYNRLAEANRINGHVLESARYIQNNIDDTYLALRQCP